MMTADSFKDIGFIEFIDLIVEGVVMLFTSITSFIELVFSYVAPYLPAALVTVVASLLIIKVVLRFV